MRNYRLFLRNRNDEEETGIPVYAKSKNGVVNVAMFSDFFSSISDDMFCTNSMYSDFKDAILSTVDVYNTKDVITLDIYEKNESSEYTRELLQIGFRKYAHALYLKARQELIDELTTVSIFVVVGVLLIIIAYGLGPFIPTWALYLISNIGTVLLWQFVGYWAFEYADQKHTMDRFKQIENIKYEFKKWE